MSQLLSILFGHRSGLAEIYVRGYCRPRRCSTDGIQLTHRMEVDDATGMVSKIWLDIHLPPESPEKSKAAIIRSSEQCTVKKQFEHPLVFGMTAIIAEPQPV